MSETRRIHTTGRLRGRTLRAGRKSALDEALPRFQLPLEAPFPRIDVLEIGFGGGEHLLARAALEPEKLFLGCEMFLQGVADATRALAASGLQNVRIFHGDARDALEKIANDSLSAVYILYPDPWPKARHHKRRFIQAEMLALLSKKIKRGGLLRIATDDAAYCAWIFSKVLAQKEFFWQAKRVSDWLNPWQGWARTRYEQKALNAGRVPTYIECVRVRVD